MIKFDLPRAANHQQIAQRLSTLLNPTQQPHQYTVNVHQVDLRTMRGYNRRFRGIDQATDVLSFPLFTSIKELPNYNTSIGDLVVCPAMFDKKHLNFEESLQHGTLHLLGFDHEYDQAKWEKVEQKINEL